MIDYRHCWAEDRVFFFDEAEQLRSLPASWTSIAPEDPFVMISAGRSFFRVCDLVELTKLVRGEDR